MAKYFDVGVNITDAMFKGCYHGRFHHQPDLTSVLVKAKAFGVDKMLLTGSSLKESTATLDFILKETPASEGKWPKLSCTAGVHPCTVLEFDENPMGHLNSLRKLVQKGLNEGIIKAFGEIGLDYDRLHYTPKEKQIEFFKLQLQLACEFNLPLFLHMRNACYDFIKILKPFLTGEEGYILKNRALLVHSFTGDELELEKILEMENQFNCQIYISINGAGLRDSHSFNVIKKIPLSKLMIETDSPWCEIKKSHPSYQLLTKSPNDFYPNVKKIENLPPISKKETPLVLHDFLPLPIVKSERFDSFKFSSLFPEGITPLIKSRNEPCLIGLVAQAVSKIKEVEPNILIDSCYRNSIMVFDNT